MICLANVYSRKWSVRGATVKELRLKGILVHKPLIRCKKFNYFRIVYFKKNPSAKQTLSLVLYITDAIKEMRSRDTSVVQRWATDWMIGGSSPDRGWELFSPPPCPDRL
jgi:hypothetical protein